MGRDRGRRRYPPCRSTITRTGPSWRYAHQGKRHVDARAVLEEHQPRLATVHARWSAEHRIGALEDRPITKNVDPVGISAVRSHGAKHERQVAVTSAVRGRGRIGARAREHAGEHPRVCPGDGKIAKPAARCDTRTASRCGRAAARLRDERDESVAPGRIAGIAEAVMARGVIDGTGSHARPASRLTCARLRAIIEIRR